MRVLLALPLLLALLFPCRAAGGEIPIRARLDSLFDALEKNELFSGTALVADGGEVVYERAAGFAVREWDVPNTMETRFRIASIGKQFTAALILVLAEEGLLSTDDPLRKILPGIDRPWADRVTIGHLLAQNSGIPNYGLIDGFLEGLAKERLSRAEFLDRLLADPLLDTLAFEPGSSFSYSNTNYLLAALAAERAAGRSYGRLLRERIFEPLGMKDSGVYDDLLFVPRLAFLYEQTPEGAFAPAARTVYSPRSGALTTTARDLFRWHRALRDGALLGKEGSRDFQAPRTMFDETRGYAYGNYVFRVPGEEGDTITVVEHGGSDPGISTLIQRIPEKDRCVILLANGGMGGERSLRAVADAIRSGLDGEPIEIPRFDLLGAMAYTCLYGDAEAIRTRYLFLKEKRADLYLFDAEQLSFIGRVAVATLGLREAAEALFRLNAEEYPEEPLVWTDLGRHLLEEGDAAAALPLLERARRLSAAPDEDLEALIRRAEEEARG